MANRELYGYEQESRNLKGIQENEMASSETSSLTSEASEALAQDKLERAIFLKDQATQSEEKEENGATRYSEGTSQVHRDSAVPHHHKMEEARETGPYHHGPPVLAKPSNAVAQAQPTTATLYRQTPQDCEEEEQAEEDPWQYEWPEDIHHSAQHPRREYVNNVVDDYADDDQSTSTVQEDITCQKTIASLTDDILHMEISRKGDNIESRKTNASMMKFLSERELIPARKQPMLLALQKENRAIMKLTREFNVLKSEKKARDDVRNLLERKVSVPHHLREFNVSDVNPEKIRLELGEVDLYKCKDTKQLFHRIFRYANENNHSTAQTLIILRMVIKNPDVKETLWDLQLDELNPKKDLEEFLTRLNKRFGKADAHLHHQALFDKASRKAMQTVTQAAYAALEILEKVKNIPPGMGKQAFQNDRMITKLDSPQMLGPKSRQHFQRFVTEMTTKRRIYSVDEIIEAAEEAESISSEIWQDHIPLNTGRLEQVNAVMPRKFDNLAKRKEYAYQKGMRRRTDRDDLFAKRRENTAEITATQQTEQVEKRNAPKNAQPRSVQRYAGGGPHFRQRPSKPNLPQQQYQQEQQRMNYYQQNNIGAQPYERNNDYYYRRPTYYRPRKQMRPRYNPRYPRRLGKRVRRPEDPIYLCAECINKEAKILFDVKCAKTDWCNMCEDTKRVNQVELCYKQPKLRQSQQATATID